MKRILSLLACLGLLLAVPVATTGCKTQNVSVRTQAGKSLETVAAGVNAAMNTYGVLYRAGKITPTTQSAVSLKYAQYQSAANTALDLLGNDQASAPINVQLLAQDLVTLISTLSK
jgi:hypothetical protein